MNPASDRAGKRRRPQRHDAALCPVTLDAGAAPMAYDIHTDVKHGPLELIDAARLARECGQKWWNQSLCLVNESVIRVGVFEGEFHWHKHDREDEFFFVLEGELLLDLEGRTATLAPGQGMMVPRGVLHRTRAQRRTVVLMVEPATVVPTGD
jgi:mannose-6-phosphate isomerase-like protein (cupin superfamily)